MLPTIDNILDTAIKYIYIQFSRLNRLDPEERSILLSSISPESVIINIFSLPSNYNSKALARPVYWHFMDNYAEKLPPQKIGNEYATFVRLKKPLPHWREFKKEILEKDWIEPYLQSNLEQLSYI